MIIDEEERNENIAGPELTERQQEEAQDRTSVSAVVVHEAIRYDGEEELQRPMSALAWSGLAASMSMGFSFVASFIASKSTRCAVEATDHKTGFTRSDF